MFTIDINDNVVFFFQAEDGIRDIGVTGVQTCALPISRLLREDGIHAGPRLPALLTVLHNGDLEGPRVRDHRPGVDPTRGRAPLRNLWSSPHYQVRYPWLAPPDPERRAPVDGGAGRLRSEEHTSELQS